MRRRCLFINGVPPVPPIRPYLRVDKPEVQWVTPDMSVDYNVESNTDWWLDQEGMPYLRLDPENVLITENNPVAEVQVYSNVAWDVMD